MLLLWLTVLFALAPHAVETRPPAAAPGVAPEIVSGPLLGPADPTAAHVWARANVAGTYRLRVHDSIGLLAGEALATATERTGLCLDWRVEGLDPGRRYAATLHAASGEPLARITLRTPLRATAPRALLAFGSCSSDARYPRQPIWRRMLASGAETIVLLGDTPYIDSTELDVQRARHDAFLRHADVAYALSRRPWYATWDDHDFGLNDTDGRLRGKSRSRQAFVEFHAGPEVGIDGEGIFTRFRRGPVEVFLLDTRWFAGVESAAENARRPSLLGGRQLRWLERGLRSSDASFKLLACGMVWNGAVRPGKRDHWMSYPDEREHLLRFLGEESIEGVVLIGGDIHRSRALRHPTRAQVGYELTELISSPLANLPMASANVPTPALLHDVGVDECFLLIEADARRAPARLSARCVGREGELLFALELSADELRAGHEAGPR